MIQSLYYNIKITREIAVPHHIFIPNPKSVPHSRLQHPKRHFRKVMREAREFTPDTSPDDWYHHWHYHADWDGNGNRGWERYRSKYFAALCIVYTKLAANINRIGCPCQLFIFLDGSDAEQDAVYFHTPNPHSEFPMAISNTRWGIPEIESRIGELLPGIRLRAGETDDGSVFIYSPDIGETIEK